MSKKSTTDRSTKEYHQNYFKNNPNVNCLYDCPNGVDCILCKRHKQSITFQILDRDYHNQYWIDHPYAIRISGCKNGPKCGYCDLRRVESNYVRMK